MKVSKQAEKHIYRTKAKQHLDPVKIKTMRHEHIKNVGMHTFSTGDKVGIFEISDYRALNQFIGYAKFVNSKYGNVYYRGEGSLHKTLLPSISRKAGSAKYEEYLTKTIKKAINDDNFSKFAKLLEFKNKKNASLVAEAMLQHYGYYTHFIDVVDNHWVALWFGLNVFKKIKNMEEYYLYEPRAINPIDSISCADIEREIYQYLILIAVDNNIAPIEQGIYCGNDVITIDLRSSLPSMFLRPHAQHGLVVRRNAHEANEGFDLSKNVIAIVRLRIDRVSKWIGTGDLLSNENLFPSPAYDQGYEVLLKRKDLFCNDFHSIAKYI